METIARADPRIDKSGKFVEYSDKLANMDIQILPFNYPMVLLAWEASAALAAGNAVIIKPSQYTSLTTLLFARAFEALPDGLFQVVTGEAPAGKFLVFGT